MGTQHVHTEPGMLGTCPASPVWPHPAAPLNSAFVDATSVHSIRQGTVALICLLPGLQVGVKIEVL